MLRLSTMQEVIRHTSTQGISNVVPSYLLICLHIRLDEIPESNKKPKLIDCKGNFFLVQTATEVTDYK